MSSPVTLPDFPLAPPASLFARLRQAVAEDWLAYTQHPFVEQLGKGTLPEAAFRHYLVQDYRFLIHFARAWALALVKADTLEDMRHAADTISALLNEEMRLHVRYCARWGISEADLEDAPEAQANLAYTRYVLERGFSGDVLDLQVALAPCIVGYAEIGRALHAQFAESLAQNPYRDWIEMYAGEAYQQVARHAILQLDRLAARRLTEARFPDLVETFRQATRLEIAFWDMGLMQRF
ncbi:thiaminase II [Rhodothermus profundi]|uniref:Aminopyrimidine aminohydrolase n=1 Tax=Rhodothermus profundi TaxID=633813 RepID=A0A1M6TY14_9BACT|nr:thiaminase II [Rhodothermus profundi]SHK61790.1 thiaminase (transcriptional activator TenA) [Rhodothermus profundi]